MSLFILHFVDLNSEFQKMAKYDLKNIPTFSGSPDENAEMFFRCFESYATLKDFTGAKKALAFELSLKDKAAGWHFCLENKDDFDSVSKKFKEKFGCGVSTEGDISWEAESKLYSVVQSADETASDYFVRVSSLAQSMKKTDIEQVKIVVRGLSPQVRTFVLSKEPKTMEQVERYIMLYESISSPLVCSGVDSVNQVDESKSEIQMLTEKVESLCTEVMNLKEQNTVNVVNKGDNVQSGPQRGFGGSSRPYRNFRRHTQSQVITCFRCAKDNHKAFECRSRYHKDGTLLGTGLPFSRRGGHLNGNGRY